MLANRALAIRRGVLAAAAAAVLALSWWGPLDAIGREHVEAGLKRALITFASARLANAVISVLQESTVAISPGGVGITTSPGQALDPLNDLIEQFSTLMLVAAVSLGVQAMMISIGGMAAVSAALTAIVAAWAWHEWNGRHAPRWLTRFVVIALFIRFAVPLSAIASEAIFRVAMSGEYAQAQGQVDATTQVIAGSVPQPDSSRAESRLDRLQRWFFEKKQQVEINFGELKARAENAVRHVVTLMAVFVIQTLVLPLFFLWLLYRLFGLTLRWP